MPEQSLAWNMAKCCFFSSIQASNFLCEIFTMNLGPNVTTAESEPEPMETASSDGFVKTQEDQIDLDLWTDVESNMSFHR